MAFSTAPLKFPSYLKSNQSKSVVFSPQQLKMKGKKGFSVGCMSDEYDLTPKHLLGIDLGTTNSVAAIGGRFGGPIVLPNSEGSHVTPSVVAYTKDGDILVGDSAKEHGIFNPDSTMSGVKRFIGKKMSEIDDKSKQVSYHLLSDDDGNVKLSVLGKHFTPVEVSAQILRKLMDDASKFLNRKLPGAVITTPAHFNESQREATKEAGRMAGLGYLRIVNEPTAASLGYGFHKRDHETILVFDLGGGTFDVSVIDAGDGVYEVLSMAGDSHLGGADFDKRIVDWLALNFHMEGGFDLLNDKVARQLLTTAAEKAKMELSYMTRVKISIPHIAVDTELSRSKFEELCWDLFERFESPVEKAIRDADLTFQDISEVILVGGSIRMPAVMEYVKKITGLVPNALPNPDEVVALGAAHLGHVLGGEVVGVVVSDIVPFSIGLGTCGGVMTKVIPRNTTLPASASAIFSTVADGQTSVDITILEGEGELASNNKCLGKFRLDGILPSPRGVAEIEVKFDIDANGILSAVAVDKETEKKENNGISANMAGRTFFCDLSPHTVSTWPVDDDKVESGADYNLEKAAQGDSWHGVVAGGLAPVVELGKAVCT